MREFFLDNSLVQEIFSYPYALRGHTHEELRFCVQIVVLHFNFLVLTLKSRCYFVYDIFAIVQTPLSCSVSLRVLRRAAFRS